jgi:hypothetical protein
MPPAFNLSQDQTLQFNLCNKKLISESIEDIASSSIYYLFMSVWHLLDQNLAIPISAKHPRLSAVNF